MNTHTHTHHIPNICSNHPHIHPFFLSFLIHFPSFFNPTIISFFLLSTCPTFIYTFSLSFLYCFFLSFILFLSINFLSVLFLYHFCLTFFLLLPVCCLSFHHVCLFFFLSETPKSSCLHCKSLSACARSCTGHDCRPLI